MCSSDLKHLVLETEYGPETATPSIDWYVENTDWPLAGYNGIDKILAGVPNLKWISDCLDIYKWKIVYYKSFVYGSNQRMIIGAVNSKYYDTSDVVDLPEHLWEWSIEPNSMTAKEFYSMDFR